SIDASKCNKSKLQSSNFSVFEHGESTDSIMLKPMIKFVKEVDCLKVIKINNTKNARKSTVKYAEMYRNISKGPKVRGNQRNWNNLKSQQLGKDFLMQNKACIKCGYFDHLESNYGVWVDNDETWTKNNYTDKSMTPRAILLKPGTTLIVVSRPNMNLAQPKTTSFAKRAHSNVKRYFQRKSTVENQPRVPRVSTVTKKIPTVDSKFLTAKSTLTADLGNKGKAIKASNNIDDKGYWDSGCSRHMTGNISYLSKYEPYDGGYVSFGHRGGKITGKGIIKTVVTDDFSRFTWTFLIKTKDETSSILRNFITEIENLKDLKVKIIGCDNGGEFKNQEMNEFYTKKGIRREFSNARTPQQNRVAERRNKTLIEAAKTILADAKLPVTFWAEAVNTALVVAGTSSTNISGTKDVASQAVKKDVSSLRYIALLNCGISNPTATSKVPIADQVEPAVSLTVESKNLTVSSPVLGIKCSVSFPLLVMKILLLDMSWTGLPEFADDTVTDYSGPAPTVESSPDDAQNRNHSVTATEASPCTISPKPFIKFMKAVDCTKVKTNKVKTVRKSSVRYAEMYRRTSKIPNMQHQVWGRIVGKKMLYLIPTASDEDSTVSAFSHCQPAPTVESSPDDAQNRNPSVTETKTSPSTISHKSFIKFVKANDSPTNNKTDKAKTAKKPPVNTRPKSTQDLVVILIQRVQRLERELKGNSGAKLEDAVRTKTSRGVVD
nr:putative ribonuclease H-like domain-containing protein [Tanacetum cinerariifolium]